jgi:ERCC4-type nuclease
MQLQFSFPKDKINEILDSIQILCDTREQKNDHITNYFRKKEITFESKKLEFGDYSFSAKILGQRLSFENRFAIERKNSLSELAGNFTNGREQFKNEFERAKIQNARMILLIENNNYADLLNANYRSQMKPQSFLASLLAYKHRYNFDFQFLENNKLSGNMIYYMCYYYLYVNLQNII